MIAFRTYKMEDIQSIAPVSTATSSFEDHKVLVGVEGNETSDKILR